MKSFIGKKRLFLAVAITVVAAGCETAPITGRQQFILIPTSQDAQLGLEAYQQILSQSTLSDDAALQSRVREVGTRIAAVSGRDDFDWEFNVIEDDSPNAFALPGGKVGMRRRTRSTMSMSWHQHRPVQSCRER